MSAKKRPNEETEFQQMTDDSCPDYSRLRIAALKLRFPAALEEEYLENYYKLTFFTPVKGIIIATVVYLSFAGLDIFASPEKSNNIIFVRFAVGLIALIGIIITYLKKIEIKNHQIPFSILIIIAGISIVYFVLQLEPSDRGHTYYPAGLLLVIIFACSGIALRFWYALTCTIILLLLFTACMIFKFPLLSEDYRDIIIIHQIDNIGGSILALFPGYSLEVYTRMDFLQRKTIEVEKIKLNNLVRTLENQNIQIEEHLAEIDRVKTNSFESQLAALRLKSLRNQMNPHFLFNCMNSIEAYIAASKPAEAQLLLQKFSKVVRELLENSQFDVIRISKETEALKNYLHLESIRLKRSFTYEIVIDDNILEKYLIPPLVIQPYVENSILHGFKGYLSFDAQILIEFKVNQAAMLCRIEDNGIGIERSYNQNSNQFKRERQSLGMQLTEERIKSFGGSIKIYDLSVFHKSGTRVEILFPLVEST